MKYAYYPGCSLEGSSEAYDCSVKAVCTELGVELLTIDDWNCCGATETSVMGRVTALSLVARNLALVEQGLEQVLAPCAACYCNLRKTEHVLCEQPALAALVGQSLAAGGLTYSPGKLSIRNLLDVLYEEIGEEEIRRKVSRPLHGLRIAPYYGCQVVRPADGHNDPEYPHRLDDLMRWLGATVVDFPLKTHCCSGHMTQISEKMSNELIRRLLKNADDWQADLIVCLCPMCQLNLDAYQGRVNDAFETSFHLPILFFTQLIGIAFGLDRTTLGLGKEIVDAGAVLDARLNNQPAETAPGSTAVPRRGAAALPFQKRY